MDYSLSRHLLRDTAIAVVVVGLFALAVVLDARYFRPGSDSLLEPITGSDAADSTFDAGRPASIGKPLFLTMQSPASETAVLGPGVLVSGFTNSDATLTINGEIAEVGLDGGFAVEVALLPGPNEVEIVASNLRGEKLSRLIDVVSLE
jgi:hypothetical protein